MITVLSGGTGGAKFVQGLKQVVSARELTLIVNTGDDVTWWGLHVSPDVDSITYALADRLSRERGWGAEGDTFHCLEVMRQLGAPGWFQLGDRDLALHIYRTQQLALGATLSEVTEEIRAALGIEAKILPMTDDRVETRVQTDMGELSFQEYFVRERYKIPVQGVRFAGATQARPAPGVIEAILDADAVLIAPSNPITSIGPILTVPEVRAALQATSARVTAVTPIVGGVAVSGPAADLMRASGLPASILGVARAYQDFIDALVADNRDADIADAVRQLGIECHCTDTLMTSDPEKAALAQFSVNLCSRRAAGGRMTA